LIKSGSNQIHGSAYEFHRDDHLDAKTLLRKQHRNHAALSSAKSVRRHPGGPIRKNKPFIFGDFEGLRDDTSGIQISSVPQSSWVLGQFNVPIYNPYDPNDKRAATFCNPLLPPVTTAKGNAGLFRQA